MQFFPHRISVNTTANAVSASVALTGSFINNFSAIAINRVLTASIALNITGSRGTDGTSISITGPTGPQGLRGDTGIRGGNIFLLSSSWNVGTCGSGLICYGSPTAYELYTVKGTECFSATQGAYYTSYGPTDLRIVTTAAADTSILFTNADCTTVASNITVTNRYRIFYTDGAGVISSVACGNPLPSPSAQCYSVFNFGPSATVSWTDINGIPRSGTLPLGQGRRICSLIPPRKINSTSFVSVINCNQPCTNVCTTIDCEPQCNCPE